MNSRPVKALPALLIGLTAAAAAVGAQAPLRPAGVAASSHLPDYPPLLAVDGEISDKSRWVGEIKGGEAWLELRWDGETEIAGLHLYTGHGARDAITDFRIQFWDGGAWRDVPSAVVNGNTATALALPFDQTVVVKTTRLRLVATAAPLDRARVKELAIWPGTAGAIPPLAAPPTQAEPLPGGEPQPAIPEIYLNQSGFNLGKPKRFTAPTLPDGTPFAVRGAGGGAALFEGKIAGHIGDFTAFDPEEAGEYVVEAGGLVSVPFGIGRWWLERVTYQNAVDFMVQSRHYTGNYRKPCKGSYAWRDDHHFAWALHTLVPQYLSNPSAYERMPRQIPYEAPADPKAWGRLEPFAEDAPDIVKLIHWGADVIVTQGLTHEMLKAQLAYFLYAWPVLERWLPAQNFTAVRDHAFEHWSKPEADRKYPYEESPEHDLLALKTQLGTTKGAYPPGFSVEPNLLMHAVARREGRADANAYLEAAVRQADWMVKNLDWNDPQTTKGQRMSEFLTVTGLAHLLREFPEAAPKGLAEKIQEWTAVVIRRSNNLWDFRKLDDAEGWTPMGSQPTMWNEPGNVVGLPAAILAARDLVPGAETRARLDQLVWSHFDNMFGRNPVGRHFSHDAPREIEGVEWGWFSFYRGGIGQLANVRFVIDGSPKNGHYPYNPGIGNVGWTEGWIQFNTAFNISLAYLAWTETRLALRRDGDGIEVRLTAPLDFDRAQAEAGSVLLSTPSGDSERVTVTETAASSQELAGRIPLERGAKPVPGDGKLQMAPGDGATGEYGFGYLGRRAVLAP